MAAAANTAAPRGRVLSSKSKSGGWLSGMRKAMSQTIDQQADAGNDAATASQRGDETDTTVSVEETGQRPAVDGQAGVKTTWQTPRGQRTRRQSRKTSRRLNKTGRRPDGGRKKENSTLKS